MNKKGFTLVELLAVIVILAIIALITAPAILNVINDAREKGAQDKAWGTIDAVRMAFVQEQGLGQGTVNSTAGYYTVCYSGSVGTSNTTNQGVCNSVKSGSNLPKVGTTTVTMNGEVPTGGAVDIDLENGTITCTNLKFTGNGNYICTSDGNKMCCVAKSSGSVAVTDCPDTAQS